MFRDGEVTVERLELATMALMGKPGACRDSEMLLGILKAMGITRPADIIGLRIALERGRTAVALLGFPPNLVEVDYLSSPAFAFEGERASLEFPSSLAREQL